MAEDINNVEGPDVKENKGLAAQGAKPSDLDPGQAGKGSAAPPAPSNEPPVVEPTAEEKAAQEAAAKAAKEKAEADKKTEEDKKVPVITEWTKFDHPSADAAVDLLKSKGLSPAEANVYFAKAIESGNLEDIDYDGLKSKIGEAATHLIQTGIENWHKDTNEKNSAVQNMAYEMFGSKEAWDTVAEWAKVREANDPAFAKELKGIRKDIDIGGRAAKAALKDLLDTYNGNPNTKGLGNEKVISPERKADSSIKALGRSEYLELLEKAERDGNKKEVEVLNRRRLAGMKQGI